MKTVLIRHGLTEQNESGIICGRLDSRLSRAGRDCAKEAGRILEGMFEFSEVYSSELRRTYETACLATGFSMAPKRVREFNEIYCGKLEGLSYFRAFLRHPIEVYRIWRAMPDHRVGGGETLRSLFERVQSKYSKIAKSHENGRSVLISGSVGTIMPILALCNGYQTIPEAMRIKRPKNCEIFVIGNDNGKPRLEQRIDSHLEKQSPWKYIL